MRWRRALGTSVIDKTTAEPVGRVDGLVIDPDTKKVVSIVVGDKLVDFAGTGGIGKDAVTVEGTDALTAPGTDLEKRAIAGDTDPLRKPVLTEDGVAMGSVADVEFNDESGVINRLVLSDDDIAGTRLLGIGSHAVVVSSTQQASASGDLGSLTRDELYEMAKQRDLEGRSAMNKRELLAALR